ncbi:hypothetical protein [Clostridium chromiireducens]|uniref:hypothetical protein n=1 Tax=Clostridium chromiireducens TaxID=225345 RepID=UPI001FAA0825|nr:hypothetical protein [Clostridium chromiireducens]
MEKDIIKQNKESWDAIADSFFGVTALPVYGFFIPTEDELGLLFCAHKQESIGYWLW